MPAALPKRRNIPPRVASARGLVARLARADADPATVEAARAQLAEANAEASILRFTSLPDEVRVRLACLLLAGGGDNAT